MTKDQQIAQEKSKALFEACLGTMGALTSLLQKEVKLVKGRKTEELHALVAEKNKLTLDYRSALRSFRQNPDLMKNAPLEMRNILMLEGKRLAEATSENERCLKSAVIATRRLVETIYAMIRKEALPTQSYANHKKDRRKSQKEDASVPPVVISRSA